jgi:hypothetical protein
MFRRKRWFILIPTLLLVPLLVGMIPMKLANKMANGGTCAHSEGKQGCGGHKNCSAQSLISQNHFDADTINASSPDQGLPYSQEALFAVPESVQPDIMTLSIPLRC